MRRFGRRRRRPVVWFPTTATAFGTGRTTDEQQAFAGIEFEDTSNGTGSPRTIEVPLVLDNPADVANSGGALANIQKTGLNFHQDFGYHLKRIVGKLWLSIIPTDPQATIDSFFVKFGLIIRRVDTTTGTSPFGEEDVDTLAYQNVRDPWIWQRAWILGGNRQDAPISRAFAAPNFASSSFEVGGTKDGPAFDIKTSRRVGPEERLILDVTWTPVPFRMATADISQSEARLNVIMDYRVLGSVHLNSGNRRNASR